jgi:acetolactate synthase-1/2/3 large subunit
MLMANLDKVRGGELLAQAIEDKGIDTVFSLCGGFLNPVYEACLDRGIRVVTCRSEAEAGHMADGWARISRRPAVCLAGPEGSALTVPAMAEAFLERTPVIFITSSSIFKRLDRGGFKEINHARMAEPVTKYSVLVNAGKRIPEFFNKAYDLATSGYTGPVHVSVPIDFLYSSYEVAESDMERRFNLQARQPTNAPRPGEREVATLFDLLKSAKRPVIIAGHGVWWGHAEKAVEALATQLRIPLFNLPFHKKMFPFDSRTCMGLADVHQYPPSEEAFNEADLFILMGARVNYLVNFGDPTFFPKSAKIATVNGSWEEVSDNHIADHRVLGNIGETAQALGELAEQSGYNADGGWFDMQLERRGQWVERTLRELPMDDGLVHPLRMCLTVIDALGEKDYLLTDGGDCWSWIDTAVNIAGWQGKKIAGVLHPGVFGLIGVSVPFSNAAKLLNPDSRVVAVSGDGAMQCSGLAIETSIQHQIPIVVVVDNNKAYGMIKVQQQTLFKQGRHYGTDLRGTPFHSMVAALGGHGELVERIEQLPGALERAFESGIPACINVMTQTLRSPLTGGLIDRRSKSSIE